MPWVKDGTTYTFQFHTEEGTGTPPLIWDSDLPAEFLSINPLTGVLTATNPTQGVYHPTITVTDRFNRSDSKILKFEVKEPVIPGTVWTAVGYVNGEVRSITKLSTGTILIFADAKIYRSTDNMLTWNQVKNCGDHYYGMYNSGVFQDEYGNVYAFASNENEIICVRSTNDGQTWSSLSSIPASWNARGGGKVVYCGGGVIVAAYTYYGSRIYVYKSTDYGATWGTPTMYQGGFTYWWSDLILIPGTSKLLAMKSNTGGPIRFFTSDVATIDFVESSTTFDATSGNPEGGFARELTGDGNIISHYWGDSSKTALSSDNGASWNVAYCGIDSLSFAMCCRRNVVIVGCQTKIMRSADNGVTFLSSSSVIDGACKALCNGNDNVFLAGTNGTTYNLYRSTM